MIAWKPRLVVKLWRSNHGISSSSRRSAGHPREGAKEGFSWHGSKEVESGCRLC